LATELLAKSYYAQSRALHGESLAAALSYARQAVTNSPDFGFGWERVAELEFSFGHTSRAIEALDKSISLAPRNAQALALRGFLLAAQNKTRDAVTQFDDALAVDSRLGNAWLGRGLTRIRKGDVDGGREDLLIAAALEPQRAVLRSYLGKAYATSGDRARARHELDLAKTLDPNDPTAWLYAALLDEQDNRINEAVRDLEKSQDLNDNRRVYRSNLLLDQDRAVRSVNLSRAYKEAGMDDVALREAVKGVNADYANYSAHLFLANTYNEFRDPNLINLRYETPMKSEYLIANLLAPSAAGVLTPAISQQEYSRLFERDRLGFYSETEYLSRGAWTEYASQFGQYGNFSYSLDAFYRTDPGQRINNDTEQKQFALIAKQQITPSDNLYIEVQENRIKAGDLAQYYDPARANATVRITEKQDPILNIGYHHEWSPQNHTLLLGSRLEDTIAIGDLAAPAILIFRPGGAFTQIQGLTFQQKYLGSLEVYSAEAQQIMQNQGHTTIVGGRFQYGHFATETAQDFPSLDQGAFDQPAAVGSFNSLFQRTSFYGYHYWEIFDAFELMGGVAYDRIIFPENFRIEPLSAAKESKDQVSPKAGFTWKPMAHSVVRFGYTRSLSGASLDQSFQLEPAQFAGFLQSFRSIIPESVAGANSAAKFETFGLSIEHELPTRTYIGVEGAILNSKVNRAAGAFLSDFLEFDNAVPIDIQDQLNFTEKTVSLTVNQLISGLWSVGARYRVSQAELREDFPGFPAGIATASFNIHQSLEALLHQVDLFAIANHPSGFFAEADGHFFSQSNNGYAPSLPGDDFFQVNAFAGYRLPGRRLEAVVGILNMSDQNYHLNPLNLYSELPRKRTLVLRLQLNF
jgi:Tfp pilus assembly protein PilF